MGIKRSKKWKKEKVLELLEMKDSERIEMIREMLSFLDHPHEKVALVLFYIYGLRPEEALELTKDNFKIVGNILIVRLPTVKDGMPREIELDVEETPFLKDVLVPYLENLKDGQRLWPPTWNDPTNFNNSVFKKIKIRSYGKYDYNPYVFRDFRESYLGYLGVPLTMLMAWKGARDVRSVSPYLTLKPIRELKKAIK